MKISRTENAIVLVGSITEVLKTLQLMSQKYKTVQEWIQSCDEQRFLYIVK